MTNKRQSARSVTTEQAGEQMPMPARLRTKDTRWRCCQKHTGVPRNSASLPKTCRKETMENGQRRSVRFRSDNTSSSLMRDPLLTTSPSLL